jgi:hypothetical protein
VIIETGENVELDFCSFVRWGLFKTGGKVGRNREFFEDFRKKCLIFKKKFREKKVLDL